MQQHLPIRFHPHLFKGEGKIKELSIINVVSYALMTASLIIMATLGFSLELMICVYLLIYFGFVVIMIISVKEILALEDQILIKPMLKV